MNEILKIQRVKHATYLLYFQELGRHLQKWQNLTENNLELQWPLQGMFQLDKIIDLRKQTEWDTYFNWYTEVSKDFKIPKQLHWKMYCKKLTEN